MSPATAIASLLFFSLLLLPQFGTCHYTSYTSGSRKFFLRSSDDSRPSTSPAAASCSSISSGLSNGKLPLVHRLSACSPLNDDGGNSEPSPADVLRRDAHRIGSLVAARSGVADAASPAPGRAPGGLVTVPTNGTPVATAPGVQDYTVLVGYGTPAQQLPLALDTSLGISLLRCKPCASGASNCDPAFDHTRSSTFAQVPCGSPDCRTNCSGSVCPLAPPFKRGTVVQDVLTLAPAAAVRDFAFGCVEVGSPGVKVAAGLHDLSRDSRSLASRLAASPAKAPSFSYCLPLSRRSHGFLSVGAGRGILDYSVMVGYGTPAQPLPMAFDTLQFPSGVSTLRCKPCRSGVPCDQAFDPARSSTFARVGCGPECPSVCHDSTCSLIVGDMNGTLITNGTFVKDTLALSSSATFPSFTLACMDMDNISNDASSTGVLDLSPSRFSLVSRVASSPTGNTTAAFSYCLPASTKSSGGFLSFGGALPDFSAGNGTGSTPLVNDTNHPMTYMIKFSGIRVDGTELPAPPQARLASLEVGLSITFLTPAIYTALRDEFRKQMAKYPLAAPYDVLDTCYNFTGISFDMPGILLQFEGGATLQPDVDQMMYFFDAAAAPHTYGCLAFAPTPDNFPFSVIGNMAQQTVEVVYDVRGGKVGFVQQSC
ncbi:hypothetical protein ACP70R_047261 [Stipagrostis hirtigluma subsp. patula]